MRSLEPRLDNIVTERKERYEERKTEERDHKAGGLCHVCRTVLMIMGLWCAIHTSVFSFWG